MKRKVVAVMLVLLLCSGAAFAALPENEIVPMYNEVEQVITTFGIVGDEAKCNILLRVGTAGDIDRAAITAKIKTLGGTTVASYSEDMLMSGSRFTFQKTKKVTTKTSYHCEYTIKCYKNNVLIDNVTGKTKSDTYV